jgi:hypothetical protein
MANMRRKIYKENFVTIEEETKVVELGVGIMIGEVAMMDKNAVRALSGNYIILTSTSKLNSSKNII